LAKLKIESYFAPEVRSEVLMAGEITIESFHYSQNMENRLEQDFQSIYNSADWDSQFLPEARSAYFRRQVINAYTHSCAMCGLRILTPEGHTVVEAAHIIPWSVHPIDHPRNGLALCRVHHWTFDEGLITVNSRFEIRISPLILDSPEIYTKPLSDLNGKKILLPDQTSMHPFIEALEWHRNKLFRGESPRNYPKLT
jgi:putative restriction endonuclease